MGPKPLNFQGFPANLQFVIHPPHTTPPAAVSAPLRGRVLAAILPLLTVIPAGCKDNLSTPPTGAGADTTGPAIHLAPAQDTLADSTGVLLVRLSASDISGIKRVDFFVLPASASFGTLTPLDTAFNAFYSVPLAKYKHGSFRFYARAADLLDHETVTDTVTVTVK